MSKKYDHVIIDACGCDTTSQRAALSVSHALLIPCKPRSFDLWAIENVAQLVEEVRMINPEIKASVFLNQTDPAGQGSENRDTIEELKNSPACSTSMRPSAAARPSPTPLLWGCPSPSCRGSTTTRKPWPRLWRYSKVALRSL